MCLSRPSSPASRSSLTRVAGVGGTSGKRSVSPQRPIRLSTVFTGAGFDSQKLASKRRATALRAIGEKVDAVVTMGGEDLIVYTVDERCAIVNNFSGNKCASGTGEFFKQQLARMDMSLEDAAKVPASTRRSCPSRRAARSS